MLGENEEKMMKIAIMGFGTIGSGTAEAVTMNQDIVKKQAGKDITIKYILDLRDFPDSPFADKITHDFQTIVTDKEVSLVVEAMGGLNPAYPFVKACLEAGKHVVTSNKALVAAHGTELLQIARDKQVNFLFEASVGGGIPIIRPLYRCLMGERIEEITGIMNGTTNFILTKMDVEGATFESALKEAQELGYAELNPEADVEGHDTCRKIAILTAMATGKEVDYEDVYTEGITKITDQDFLYAEKLNASVKLFGSSQIEENQAKIWVAPVMVGKNHPLYAVSDVYNGIVVEGNLLGTSMYYGSGAGKLPTASAVLADIIECAINEDKNIPIGWSSERLQVADMKESTHAYFMRIVGDYNQMCDQIAAAFGEVTVIELEGQDEFAIVTGQMKEADVLQKKESFEVRQMIRAQI